MTDTTQSTETIPNIGTEALATETAAQPEAVAPEATQQQANAEQTPATDEAASETTETEQVGAPEKYEFVAPEGVELNPAVMGEFETAARELNLPQEAAQKLVDKMIPVIAKQTQEAQQAMFDAARNAWMEQTKTDKEFGGSKLSESLAKANTALEKTATPELRKLLSETGLSEHPEVIRHFLKLGKTLSDDAFVPSGSATSGNRDYASTLYPS